MSLTTDPAAGEVSTPNSLQTITHLILELRHDEGIYLDGPGTISLARTTSRSQIRVSIKAPLSTNITRYKLEE